MKTDIIVTTFNGNSIQCEIELFLEDLSINQGALCPQLLSKNACAQVQENILNILARVFPDIRFSSVGYAIVSRDLENMHENRLQTDISTLVETICQLILESVAQRIGAPGDSSLDMLRERQETFKTVFLGESPTAPRTQVIRLQELFRDRKYQSAETLLKELKKSQLSSTEQSLVLPVELRLKLRDTACDMAAMKALFAAYRERHADDPRLMKVGYFTMIRATEDCRNMREPRAHLREFERQYPVSILSPEELALYHYHKGRAEYGRGEFLGALDQLSHAAEYAWKNDERLLAGINNIAANCFSDNLFFEQAHYLALASLNTRKKQDLAEIFESQGCLAGIAFKQAQFEKAWQLFREYEQMAEHIDLSRDEINRLNNYLAKAATMVDEYELAKEYLSRAQEYGDRLGFSATIKMLLLLRQRQYKDMDEWFTQTSMMPENHTQYDKFALGWSYAFMAQAEFARKAFNSGVKHLSRAVGFFQSDLYHLEAACICSWLYSPALPDEALALFDKIQPIDTIIEAFEKYATKHADIPHLHAGTLLSEFDKKTPEKVRLLLLLQHIEDIADLPPPSTEATKFLDSICLY